MDDELLYIRELETSELIDIVLNMWGLEEMSRALIELDERKPRKALELGIDILQNDKGDDYLQGIVLGIIFGTSPAEVIDCLCRRNNIIGKVLFTDILRKLNNRYDIKDVKKIPIVFINKLSDTYKSLEEEEFQAELSEAFNEIMEKINN